MRSPVPSAPSPMARLLVPAHLARLIRALAESTSLDDDSLHERATQLAWRRLVANRLGNEWAELLQVLQRSLDRPPHAAIVRPEDAVPSEELLAALAASLGIMADPYRKDWSRILQQIRMREDGSMADARWHTDSPGWPRPNDITCLLCVRPAAAGGSTEILPWPAAYRTLSAEPGLLLRMITCQVRWVLDSGLGGGEVCEPIITETGIRYMREAFERAADSHPDQTVTVNGLYSAARERLDDATDFLSIRLAAGEVLIFDNTRCLHRRGPLDHEGGRERTLVRVRVQAPAWTRAAVPIVSGMDHVNWGERHLIELAGAAVQ
jgi:hypothetical protein